jgi:hypothetical protein
MNPNPRSRTRRLIMPFIEASGRSYVRGVG